MDWIAIRLMVDFLAGNPSAPTWQIRQMKETVKFQLAEALRNYAKDTDCSNSIMIGTQAIERFHKIKASWLSDMRELDGYRERIDSGSDWAGVDRLKEILSTMEDIYADKWGEG